MPLGWVPRFGANVWLIQTNTFLVFVGLGVFALIFNLYLASLGLKEDFVGLFAFVNTAAIGGFAFPAGMLSNRYGPRACVAIASVTNGLGAVLLSVTSQPALMLAGAVLLGASNAHIFVPTGPFLMEHSEDEERLLVFSTNFAAISLASVLGSVASGYLPSVFAGAFGLEAAQSTPAYRATLLVGAAFCFLAAVPPLLVRPRARERVMGKPTTPTDAPLGELEARRLLVVIGIAVAIIAVATGLVLPFYNVYLSEQLGASVEQIGVIYAAASLLMVPCSLAGPVLSRHLGVVGAVALPRALTVPFLLSLAMVPSLSLGSAVYVIRAGLVSATWPIDNSFAMGLMPPRLRAMQAAVRSASWNVGWSVASLVAGQVIVWIGYGVVFAASGLITLLGTVYFYLAFRRHQAKRPAAVIRVPSQG